MMPPNPMHFYEKKARRPPAVPIVSLIDILAILLIFFIVTSTFKERRDILNISLPNAGAIGERATPEDRATVSVTAEGEIFFDGDPVAAEALPATLQRFRADNPDRKLDLKADEATDLGTLVKVWDALTQAGFKIRDVPARIQIVEPAPAPAPAPPPPEN
ncbi:MAG: biopolymer transporter ExbD [Verrucomicrobiales bacterium]